MIDGVRHDGDLRMVRSEISPISLISTGNGQRQEESRGRGNRESLGSYHFEGFEKVWGETRTFGTSGTKL